MNNPLETRASGMYGLIGTSKPMRELYKNIQNLAAADTAVVIIGEGGTGKGLIANALHHYGKRNGKPFVTVDCSGFPPEVLENERFWYRKVKGPYISRKTYRQGNLQRADGGTLFLYRMGMSTHALEVLSGILRERVVATADDMKPDTIDVRVIANGLDGDFLFNTLDPAVIRVPSLKERTEDIHLLAEYFGEGYARHLKSNFILGIPAGEVLKSYEWPGNVRELKGVIQRAVASYPKIWQGSKILLQADYLSKILAEHRNAYRESISLEYPITLGEAEKKIILTTLEECNGNITRAARVLEISFRGLEDKLKKLYAE